MDAVALCLPPWALWQVWRVGAGVEEPALCGPEGGLQTSMSAQHLLDIPGGVGDETGALSVTHVAQI